MPRYVARPTPAIDRWIAKNGPKFPNLDACWRAALTKIERDPMMGTEVGENFRGVLFPSDRDIAANAAMKMFPQLLIAYRVGVTSAVDIVEAKVKGTADEVEATAGSAPTRTAPPSALVIEPDSLLRAIIRSTLSYVGFDPVLVAADGVDGRELANITAPDLVVIALDAPPEPGPGLIYGLRDTVGAVDPLVPIIALGDFASDAEVLAARDAGANELLARPLTIAALFERIEEVVIRPRPFIICETYFGPDRRRAQRAFDGPERRSDAQAEPLPDPHSVDPHAQFAENMRKRMAGEA